MTTQEIQALYEQTIKAIDSRELKAAFDSLLSLIAGSRTYMFQDELNGMVETYKQMLHYYASGSKDPMRARIYNGLLANAYELADKISKQLLMASSSSLYYASKRTFKVRPENIVQLTKTAQSSYETNDIQTAESSVIQIFKKIWTADDLEEEEMRALHDMLATSRAGDGVSTINCQIVSALTIALQASFNRKKVQLLFDAAESPDEKTKIRAYVGLLVILYLYRFRTECYPEISHRLDALSEKPDFKRLIYLIIKRFILSRETEKISHKLQDEIIPEMMKLNPKFNPRVSWQDFSKENFEESMNPEWMQMFSDSKLGKKIEEFNELQEEGADVMHSTFVHMKNFPFFNEISNWFLPFTKKRTSANDDLIFKALDMITQAGYMCDSDLYSLYFSMQQIPEAGRKMMMSQLEAQASALKEQQFANLQTNGDNAERIVGQYVQDLYRFYKLFPRRDEFNDIFLEKLDFHNLPIMQKYLSDKTMLANVAEYYLRKNYFEDALDIYERLDCPHGNDEIMLQKKGYCKQMTGDYEGAIEDYAKAELMNAESKWLLRHAAQCCRAIRRPEKAIEYYMRCEKLDPNNLSVLLSIGSCYLEMKNYSEALKYYFKADYLDPDSNKAWRAIAWCSFLTGKFSQARNYYSKLTSLQPDSHDYMNAGHTEWALQNIKGALPLYKKSAELSGGYDNFRAEFDRDVPDLAAAGVDLSEMPLMMDELRYSLFP